MQRRFDPERDRESVHRIWRECGWITKDQAQWMDHFVDGGTAWVAELGGAAECLVVTMPGSIRHLDSDMPFCLISCVNTSRVARRQGLAGRLTAHALAQAASEGAVVVGLGMFEQGYYDKLGFGSGPCETWVGFDPARLLIDLEPRVPRRITVDDWAQVHAWRLARRLGHGGVHVTSAAFTRESMGMSDNGFGLGYDEGHHFWCTAKDTELGPYIVHWLCYRTPTEFLELMALLRNLGDQVRLIQLAEPAQMQIQDLVSAPLSQRQITFNGRFQARSSALAYWQMRICDLPAALARTHLVGEPLRFNLTLNDPVERYLSDDASWRGIGGEYVVSLGAQCEALTGQDAALPTLAASVGAFTRLWLGVRPASGLSATDSLSGPTELLDQLDRLFCLPVPSPDWDF